MDLIQGTGNLLDTGFDQFEFPLALAGKKFLFQVVCEGITPFEKNFCFFCFLGRHSHFISAALPDFEAVQVR